MARMSIDDMFLRDPRVVHLAELCGWSVRETRGALLDVWAICYDQMSPELSPGAVTRAGAHPEFANFMVTCELARVQRSGKLLISGVKRRIEYIAKKIIAGKQGGLKSAKVKRNSVKQTSSTTPSTPQADGNPVVVAVVPDVAVAAAVVVDVAAAVVPDTSLRSVGARAGGAPVRGGGTGPQAAQGDGSERAVAKAVVVAKVGPEHARAFSRVKLEIGSTAIGPSPVDSFTELRALLDVIPLDGAVERCMHVLAVREAEARQTKSLKYFGSAIWKRQSFEKALTLELADVNGTRRSGPEETGLEAALRMAAEE